ncbi:MAG: hypothetical protein ABIV47_07180 [Roseiflexaceae bacterium]
MHTRKTLGLNWWRNVTIGATLTLWIGIALLLTAPMPVARGEERLAVASPANLDRGSMRTSGDAFRFGDRAHPPARAIAPQAADSTLSGRVVNADGSPFTRTGSSSSDASIYAFRFDGAYDFTYLANDGTFSINLEAGVYEIWVWLDSAIYSSKGVPAPFYLSISGITAIGDIALIERNATISGYVRFGVSGQAAGVQVNAWGPQGEHFSAITGAAGQYSLVVTPGTWQVSPDLLYNTNFIFTGIPEIADVDNSHPATIDFSVEQTSGRITGSVVNQDDNTAVTDIVGWAYVRRNNGEVLQWAPIDNGTFSMPAPGIISSDQLHVGLYIDPGSNYSSPGETTLSNTAPTFIAKMPVQPHDAFITGHVYIAEDASHTTVKNVDGLVVLTQLNGSAGAPITKSAPIDPATGTYSINVSSGAWLVTYQVFTDTYQADLSDPMLVTVAGQQIIPLDLPLTSLDGFVTAEVRDQDGVPQPNVTVWVRYGTQEVYGETDAKGQVTLYVPYSSLGLTARIISPQGQQQPPMTIGTSYSNCKQSNKPDKPAPKGKKCTNSSVVLTKAPTPKPKPGGLLASGIDAPVRLALRDTNTVLAGRVLDANGQTPRADAFVAAWSSNGQWISGFTAADGVFSLPIVQDSTISTTWQLSASYWDSDALKLLRQRVSLNVAAGRAPTPPIAAGDLTLQQITTALPPSESQHFSNSDGLALPLADGTLLQIPPDAMPDGFGSTIRITVVPQIALPSTDLSRLATFYGYAIHLYDAQTGKPIEQPLKQAATITFSYTAAQLQQLGMSEGDLQPAQFADDAWHVAEGFLQDTQGDVKTISLETTTLDSWALVVAQHVNAQAGGARVYLPLLTR